MKSKVSTMFGVLVLGGTMLAQAQETPVTPELEKVCQIELRLNKYQLGQPTKTESTCLDGKTNEEALQILETLKEDTCLTPFCGCWLG